MSTPADITRVTRFVPPPHEDDPEALKEYLSDRFRELYAALSGALRWQNLRSTLFSQEAVPSGGVSGTAQTMTLTHNLGKVPEMFWWTANLPQVGTVTFDLYATAPDRALWSTSTIQLSYVWNGASNPDPLVDVFVL